ncbi:MAG TPA: hypothetical protein VNX28_19270 [Gemmataceae bacterium]|jgi:hypothetical protein|nr:hypothetical protein [Gemmataceae bacterium]
MSQETVVSSRNRPTATPWLLPLLAGTMVLFVLGGIGKMLLDVRDWREDLQRPRERWDVGD